MTALEKLLTAQRRTGSLLSIGLEPSPEYLPDGFPADLQGYEDFLRLILDATEGLCCAYKFNVAFFESLGWEGWEMLKTVRAHVPSDVLLIADAKRGDIGSTAKHYATSLYTVLGADSATVNPLMGRDSAEPFLAHADKLTFFLGLTSNSGAADFLLKNNLYADITRAVSSWNGAGNCGLVTGATQSEKLAEIRALAGPTIPFLVPGIGAQGGDLKATLTAASVTKNDPRLIIHVTRGVLPAKGETGDAGDIIRRKTIEWNNRVSEAQG